ncbi:MAG: alpha/beta fold hydrolase [Promethearchaeota archaeon]
MYYEIHGDTKGLPILFLHGLGLDHRTLQSTFEPIFSKLENQSQFKRIYLNLPGMGQSSVSPEILSSDDILDLIRQFIDYILEDQKFLIVGESYGGYLARGIIHQISTRIKGAVFICPVIIPEKKDRTVPDRNIIERDEKFLLTLDDLEREDFVEYSVIQNKQQWIRFAENIRPAFSTINQDFVRELFHYRYRISQNVDEIDSPYSFPTIFLMGRQDHVVGYRDAWNILKNYTRSSFLLIDKAGHNLALEQQELVRKILQRFLEEI